MLKVSVILTTYNSERFIQRALTSLKSQEGQGKLFTLEILVIDDCSSDTTVEILNQNGIDFLSTSKNSGGPNTGRNIGLKSATGDYIVIMDHDDEWLPNRIKQQLKYAELAPIVTCGYNVIENDLKYIPKVSKSTSKVIQYKKNETFIDKISKVKNKQITYLGSIMFNSSLKQIIFEEYFGQIDFDWIARIFHQNNSIEVCDKLYNRYVYDENLSLNKTYRIRDYYFSLMTLEEFVKDYPKEVNLGRKRINGTRARYHYLIGEKTEARYYFKKSSFNLKTVLFLLTSFVGHKLVVKKFNFFG